MAKSYYDVLGVSKDASADEIKSAYRKLARQYHPDLHPGDEAAAAKFKEISEAYDTLGDEQKRAEYDNPNPFSGAGGGFEGFGGFGGFGGGGGIFDSIFDMFGGGSSRQQQTVKKGNDIEQSVVLTFEEAAFGVEKEFKFTRSQTCTSCSGTGAKDGKEFSTCGTCNGQGRVRVTQNTPFGTVSSTRGCSACRGTGKIIKKSCPDCAGKGYVRRNVTRKVNLPAGVESDVVLSVRGEGDQVAGGVNGDLIIHVSVMKHAYYTRRGRDLYIDYPVTFAQAILGETVQIPSIKGDPISYTIPEGTISGYTTKISRMGITTKKGTGDLYLTIVVDMPKRLSKSQKEAISKVAEQFKDDQYEKIKAFNKKK